MSDSPSRPASVRVGTQPLVASSSLAHLPGFTVREEVQRGSGHVIYRATRERDQRHVLLKVVSGDTATRHDAEALRREYEVLREVDAPGVPAVLDLVAQGDRVALVLEDAGGNNLKALLAGSRLDLATALEIGISLTATLDGVHRRGIVHADVNPNNVLADVHGKQAVLLNFNLASRSPIEPPSLGHPNVLRGTIAYMAPEQTGRVNHPVDNRSDLYSLGVTLYELLTGTLPFDSDDPLELVHHHLAQAPPPLHEVDDTIPQPVSAIVLRLLAKVGEGRYQGAGGLRADLERCLDEYLTTGTVAEFALGQHDVPDRFTIARRLYGREAEVARLQRAFDEATEGVALVLVSGYSGIGKTSLIQELYQSISRRRGYFTGGKFAQLGGSPYDAMAQAFSDFTRQILTEDEPQVAAWKATILQAVGLSGQVLIDVIPSLELLLGKQPPVPRLGATESQNRLNWAFRQFLGVAADEARPLVLFLDDLQWADLATLQLLETLPRNRDIKGLLVIGAYRDNEVDAAHPLHQALASVRDGAGCVEEIELGPLALEDLTRMIADALRCSLERASPLGRLVLRKTDGNPFFVTQFLAELHRNGQLEFDHALREWRFDLDRIETVHLTANVVDLMARRILRLAPGGRNLLTTAACIGNRFAAATIATLQDSTPEAMAEHLREAIDEGLILSEQGESCESGSDAPGGLTYRFLHDRVQQAAYALIPETERPSLHLRVGRLMRETAGAVAEREGHLFELVKHLNIGAALIDDPAERLELAKLNRDAGSRARSSAAFGAALRYFRKAAELLPPSAWATHYGLVFPLHLAIAECEYLAGLFQEAEATLESLESRAASLLDQAEIAALRIVRYENTSRYAEAVVSGRAILAQLGVELPEDDEAISELLESEVETIQALLDNRTIASLVELPPMPGAATRMTMRILAAMWAPSYLSGAQRLTRVISATMVRLSLQHGNSEESAYGYVTHAITVGPERGDYRAALEWGELALAVNDRLTDKRLSAKIHQQFNAHVNPWRNPLATCIPHAREACRIGLETGDFTYAGYGAFTETWAGFLTAENLDAYERAHEATPALLEEIKMTDLVDAQRLFLNWGRALQGRTAGRLSLSSADFDETRYAAAHGPNPFFLFFLHVARLHVFYMMEEYSRAYEEAKRAGEVSFAVGGTIWPVMLSFWRGLTVASLSPSVSEADRVGAWAELTGAWESLGILAEHCPENFRCPASLLAAEMHRLEGRASLAVDLYEDAIRYAREVNSTQYEALANERYGKFWLARGQRQAVEVFLTDAYRGYLRWGATAKARDLMRRYGEAIVAPAPEAMLAQPMTLTTVETEPGFLDLATVMKAAEAITGEMELPRLLDTLMRILIENAGAQRGVLVLDREGEWLVQAEGSTARGIVNVLQGQPPTDAVVPAAIVNYVRRTAESVVLADAASEHAFALDPYLIDNQTKSILCTPVLSHGMLVGVVYLENDLITGAFTADRIRVVQMLSSLAAISLRNADLFAEVSKLRDRYQAENVYLQEEIKTQHGFEDIIGRSPAFVRVLQLVEQVAPTDATVLLIGETGTGKELVARAIHRMSPRGDGPLINVNCGAIAPGLIESELFGHERGAFTGAVARKIGRFELADGGTLFLDEIGDLDPSLQVKLLRVLQEGEIERVGGTKTITVDVRIIAATHASLEDAVQDGRFRSDLFYRLNVFPIHTPPLREHPDDIPLLTRYFVMQYAAKLGKRIDTIPKRVLDALTAYAWPGNVRELRNVIERSVILSTGPTLQLAGWIAPGRGRAVPQGADTLDQIQRDHILQVLERTGWRVSGPRGAASVLGLRPTTLESRMKKLGIQRPTPSHDIS